MNQEAKTRPLINGSKVQRTDRQLRSNRHVGEDRNAFNRTMKQEVASDEVLKVCILFDRGVSARRAKDFVRRVCHSEPFWLSLVRAGEHLTSYEGLCSARDASRVDLMIVAAETDRDLPSVTENWLKQWATLRNDDQEGAVVALVTNNAISAECDSPMITSLKSLAGADKLDFFYGSVANVGEPRQVRTHSKINDKTAHKRQKIVKTCEGGGDSGTEVSFPVQITTISRTPCTAQPGANHFHSSLKTRPIPLFLTAASMPQ
jgi:hypothetical protein